MRHSRPGLVFARLLVGLGILVLVAAACSDGGEDQPAGRPSATGPSDGDNAGAPSVDIRLSEWAVERSVATAQAGDLTFNIENAGTTVHNFLVVRTDLAPDALPVDAERNIVDEAQVEVLLGSSTLDPEASETATVNLQAGRYVLLCNVPTHYDQGMFVGFTVE